MREALLVVHYTPPRVIGGVEQVIQQHVARLEERGFDVQVVAGRQSDDASVEVIPEIDAARPENQVLEAELTAGIVTNRFHTTIQRIVERLSSLLAVADWVIVHNAFTLHFSLPLTAALWRIAETRPPGTTIAWSHDLAWTNPLYQPVLHGDYPWSLLREPAPNTRYVTVTQQRRAELAGLWGAHEKEITVIPNGIDPDEFLRLSSAGRAITRTYGIYDRDIVLLLPVRMTRRKNIEVALHVVSCLKNRGLRPCLLVTGPTAPHHPARSREYAAELKSLRETLNLEHEVIFLAEELNRAPDVALLTDLYALADVLLFPSAHEGFGLPILEAALARVPAVLSDIPVFREVAGDNARMFALESSPDSIADQVVAAINEAPSRLRRRVLREYRWDAIIDQQLIPFLRQASRPEIRTEGAVPARSDRR